MARRFIKCAAVGLAVVTASMSTAESAGAARPIRPTHLVTCDVYAVVPQQWYRGTMVTSNGHIMCNSPADVANTTVIIWRYDGGGHYTKLVSKTSNQTGTDWWLVAQRGCDYSRAFPMHTQVITDYFHGNWAESSDNSETVTMYC
jgi:hypothetical protein